ncbi:MAG: hypothetical protein ABL879_01605 [Devosia sp.]
MAELQEQGFKPPGIDYWDDPMGFLDGLIAWLEEKGSSAAEPIVTLQ